MEYLSRSWSVSASEISKILVGGSKKSSVAAASRLPEMGTAIPEDPVLPAASIVPLPFHHQHVRNPRHTASFFALHFFFVTISFRLIHGADEKKSVQRDPRRNSMSSVSHHQSIGKWFKVHHRETCRVKQSSKEKQRAEKAQVHAMVSVARVAAAVAAATSSDIQTSKMAAAMASATELLASHCVEKAQLAGAGRDQVACAVQTAVGVRSPGDLMTLTAAAATGMQTDISVTLKKSPYCFMKEYA
jgi:hypothetical protein